MPRKLNILQLINVRWYNACAHYGIALSRALKERGHQVIVAGDPGAPPLIKAGKLGLATYEDLFLSYGSPWMVAYNIKRMVDLVRREKIDVIQAHRGEGHLVAALSKYFFKREVPLIRTRGDVRTPRNNLFNRYLNHKLTDKIITTCGALRASYTSNLKMPQDKVVEIPVGIDHVFFAPGTAGGNQREKLDIPSGHLVVGMVGRLSPVKGHRYFIRSAEYVLEELPQTCFIICGENAQLRAEDLKEEVRSRNMEGNFRFIGRIKDIREVISLLDVGVISSIGSETICRVALEYMSMGKPVVGSRVNAIPEVVQDDVSGFVVRPENSRELAQAIITLLRDGRKRKEFGERSRSMVSERFTLDEFARKTEEVYLSLLN